MNELKESRPHSIGNVRALQPSTPPFPERRQICIKFDERTAITNQQFESNGFAVTQIDFIDMFETQKLVRSIDEFVDDVATEFNCSAQEYLATTNYWRLPCKLTQDVDQWLIHEILFELEKCFRTRDIKPTTSFLINMKNVAIDEGWADISKTPYDFRVWTPCFVDDYTKLELSDRFEIVSGSDDNVTNFYTPKIGESLILRYNTKFKLIGPTQCDHFYFVSEWKWKRANGMMTMNQGATIDCNLFADSKLYEKIKYTLLLGLEKLRRLYFQYDLMECVIDWLRLLDLYEDASVLRCHRLIDEYINIPVARQTLKLFRIFLAAKDHHGRNLTEKIFLKQLDNDLLQPIVNYMKRSVFRSQPRIEFGFNQQQLFP